MRASVVTLGCKVNEYESQSIMRQLQEAGYEIAEGLVKADVYVVNTCAVTNTGERKSHQVLTKIKKLNKDAKIIVCGCAVQNNASKFLIDSNVFAVLGNAGKEDILKFVNKRNNKLPDLFDKSYKTMSRPIESKTRQFIKIQDGCDYFCTYCIIPYLRGRSRSRDLQDILDEIKNTKSNEIVLTGINMSDYRIEGQLALPKLIEEVDKIGKRFRISSIECNIIDKNLLEILSKSKNFCPHFHLSLQSACNETLKRMNRRYTIEEFKEKVNLIRDVFPFASISTDIIVGFKGETDEEFETTYRNLKDIHFSFMHIFPYSIRSGTVASKMTGDVKKLVVKERESRVIELNGQLKNDFYQNNLNTIHKVLVEVVDENCSYGYTDNYIYTEINEILPVGSIVDVKLTKLDDDGMMAELKK